MIKDSKHAQERVDYSAKGMGAAPPAVGQEKSKYSHKRVVQ